MEARIENALPPEIVLTIPPDLSARIYANEGTDDACIRACLLEAIERMLDDAEDIREGERVLAEVRAGRMKTYSLAEVERELDELES